MTEENDLQTIAKNSMNFGDFHTKASQTKFQKDNRSEPTNLFLLAKSCPNFATFHELSKEIVE